MHSSLHVPPMDVDVSEGVVTVAFGNGVWANLDAGIVLFVSTFGEELMVVMARVT